MQAITFALVSYVTWGVGILFEAIAARQIESKSGTFWGLLLGFILSILYVPFVLNDLQLLSPTVVLVNLIVAFFFIGGTIIYYDALKRGNPSLVGTIASSFPFVIVILSMLFLREKLSFNQGMAIIVIFFGLFLSILNLKELYKKKSILNPGVGLALLTMISWGIALTFIKIPINKIGWFWPNLFIFALFPVMYLYMKLDKTKLEFPKKNVLIPLIISILCVRTAEFSYNFALTKGYASVVAPIAGANPTLFVILAFFVFKQKLTRHQLLGIVITLVGIVTLSFLSV